MRILIMEGSLNPPSFIRNLMSELILQGVDVGLIGKRSASRFNPPQARGKFKFMYYPIVNSIEQMAVFIFFLLFKPFTFFNAFRIVDASTPLKLYIKKTVLYSKIIQYKPDVIHIQWATHVREYEDLIRSKKFKIVVSLRGRQINISPVVNPAFTELYQRIFPQISAFHAVSKAIAQQASKYGAMLEKTQVIYSPVPDFFIQSFCEEDGFLRSPFKILSVGRFHWKKGYMYALDAMKILKEKDVSFRYTIIAQGKIPDELIHQIHTLNLYDCVSIINGIPYDRMVQEMKKYSVFFLPSLEEGIANVVLEAMAIGLPVVSTDCGGMGEVVIHGETGLLVSRRDSESMANGLLTLQEMSEREVTCLRKNAWQKLNENFSQPQQVQKFINFYCSIS